MVGPVFLDAVGLVQEGVQSRLKEADLHQLIGDPSTARRLLEDLVQGHEDDVSLMGPYVKGLALAGAEREAIEAYQDLIKRFGWEADEEGALLEQVAWASLSKGIQSPSAETQWISLVSAAFTRSAGAVEYLVGMLRSSQAHHRLVALELAVTMRDEPLKKEVKRLVTEERLHPIRLAAIQAVGLLHLSEMRSTLEGLIASQEASAEEKAAAIEAVISLLDRVELAELRALMSHSRAGLRQLACEAIGQLELVDATALLLPCLHDSHPQVRCSAIWSLELLDADHDYLLEVKPLLTDSDPQVALAAARYLLVRGDRAGGLCIATHLDSNRPQTARLAAGTLAASGTHALTLASEHLHSHKDPFVRANLAIALLNQRYEVERAVQELASVLTNEQGLWMWDESGALGISMFSPSRVRHELSVSNQPELVNALTRLDILGLLARTGYQGVEGLMRQFLRSHNWGISGTAAVALLAVGDEAALEVIRQLLNDPDASLRIQSALALAIWGKDLSAVPTLEKEYRNANRQMRLRILQALGCIASRSSLSFLLEQLSDPSQILRAVTASVIIACLNG